MPIYESFSRNAILGKYTNTVYADYVGSWDVQDFADGTIEGQTAVGQDVMVQVTSSGGAAYSPGGELPLVGTTPNGVVVSGTAYNYLLTNTSYASSTVISINTTDPYTYCFLEGTCIETPEGSRPVESIKIGDTVLSADGRELTVRWMGHETVRNGIGASIHKAPIKVAAGAFGDGLPHQDLYVSNAHAFLLDDHLVVASALVNGETITAVPFSEMPAEFTYWHIEVEEHELIVANGVAAETLAGAPERKDFDNYDSYVAQYGADRIIQPMAYPRIKDIAQMPDALVERFNLTRPALDWDALLSEEGAKVVLKQANS